LAPLLRIDAPDEFGIPVSMQANVATDEVGIPTSLWAHRRTKVIEQGFAPVGREHAVIVTVEAVVAEFRSRRIRHTCVHAGNAQRS